MNVEAKRERQKSLFGNVNKRMVTVEWIFAPFWWPKNIFSFFFVGGVDYNI